MKGAASQSNTENRSNANSVSTAAVGFAPPSPVVQRVKQRTNNITIKKQERKNWCWAAVCEAYTGISQTDLANKYTSGWSPNGPGKYFDPVDVLNAERKVPVDVTPETIPDWKELTYIIDLGSTPTLMVGPHFIILCGYKGNTGNDKDRRYLYKDPADGDQLQEATQEELTNMNGGYKGFLDVHD